LTELLLTLLLVTDQACLIRISVTMLHRIACLDYDSITLVEYSAPWTRDSSAVVMRLSATARDILQLIAASVVVVSLSGSSCGATEDGEELNEE
jgi:hypothetical protein